MTGGNKPDPVVLAEMELLGASPQQLADYQSDQQTCFVFPWHFPALTAFCAVETQWCRDSQDRLTGLDYNRAKVAWDLRKIALSPADFERVQTIEAAVLDVLNEQS